MGISLTIQERCLHAVLLHVVYCQEAGNSPQNHKRSTCIVHLMVL